jgi:acyl-CoA hydrolase
VNFESTVVKAGKSSFQVQVDAYAEGREHDKRLACTALITMVAVVKDENGEYQKLDHGKTVD